AQFGVDRLTEPFRQLVERRGGRLARIREVAVRLQIEGNVERLRALTADQKRPLVAQRVSDAELVEDVGVVNRDVRDQEISREESLKQVYADVSLPQHVHRGAPGDAQAVEGRIDQQPFDLVEVDSALHAGRSDDERAHACSLKDRHDPEHSYVGG